MRARAAQTKTNINKQVSEGAGGAERRAPPRLAVEEEEVPDARVVGDGEVEPWWDALEVAPRGLHLGVETGAGEGQRDEGQGVGTGAQGVRGCGVASGRCVAAGSIAGGTRPEDFLDHEAEGGVVVHELLVVEDRHADPQEHPAGGEGAACGAGARAGSCQSGAARGGRRLAARPVARRGSTEGGSAGGAPKGK